jgi:hypothetical protein
MPDLPRRTNHDRRGPHQPADRAGFGRDGHARRLLPPFAAGWAQAPRGLQFGPARPFSFDALAERARQRRPGRTRRRAGPPPTW